MCPVWVRVRPLTLVEAALEADKLNREGRVMKKKDNAEPLKQTEKIDKIWEKISDLNPY